MVGMDELRPDSGDVMGRRRALALVSAIALGLTTDLVAPRFAALAKKGNKRSKGSKKKRKSSKGKHKKRGKSSTSQSSGGKAKNVVKVAMKYKGAKYVMGGASPKGFDCSGFTWYVYQQATGKDIGRTVDDQWKQGSSVGRGSWQPGDIVFFENTFKRGLSHCGIFTGGGEFIHAENEDTGVVISKIDSDYYDAHYAGARRLL
jgi:cell wall-associated NlpC family hydrolase